MGNTIFQATCQLNTCQPRELVVCSGTGRSFILHVHTTDRNNIITETYSSEYWEKHIVHIPPYIAFTEDLASTTVSLKFRLQRHSSPTDQVRTTTQPHPHSRALALTFWPGKPSLQEDEVLPQWFATFDSRATWGLVLKGHFKKWTKIIGFFPGPQNRFSCL